MTHRSAPRLLCLLVLSLTCHAFAANEDVVKPLKTLIGSIRYGKDLAALKNFAAEEQAKILVGGAEWEKATPEQRKEFLTLFPVLFAKMSFPKVRANFEHLETVLYEEPKVTGDKAEVGSTIVILHPMKKQEIKVRYQLLKDKGAWKVAEVVVLGDPVMQGIHESQVAPILKDGGWPELLKTMKAKAKELESTPLK